MFMEVELCLESDWHGHSVLQLWLSSAIAIEGELKTLCTIEERRRIISLVGHVK